MEYPNFIIIHNLIFTRLDSNDEIKREPKYIKLIPYAGIISLTDIYTYTEVKRAFPNTVEYNELKVYFAQK